MKASFVSRNITFLIIAINVIVFFLWMLASTSFMANNFLVSSSSVLEGRVWTLLTSVFSHNQIFHLTINMLVLYSFGRVMQIVLTPKRFLVLYLAAGIVGSISHCLTSSYFLGSDYIPALGASGAISGVLVVFSLIYPKQLLYVFGIIPIPALVGALIFIAFDIFGLLTQAAGSSIPIGHGAHLGGALMGFIYFLFFVKKQKHSDHN